MRGVAAICTLSSSPRWLEAFKRAEFDHFEVVLTWKNAGSSDGQRHQLRGAPVGNVLHQLHLFQGVPAERERDVCAGDGLRPGSSHFPTRFRWISPSFFFFSLFPFWFSVLVLPFSVAFFFCFAFCCSCKMADRAIASCDGLHCDLPSSPRNVASQKGAKTDHFLVLLRRATATQ